MKIRRDRCDEAWAKAPILAEFRQGTEPLRIKAKVFRAIIARVKDRRDGLIRVLALDRPDGKKRLRQEICWERNGMSRIFRCQTKKPMALEYRVVLDLGRLTSSLSD
ncbi:MAG: hypothetical protein WC675_00715 [Patescibacteria group bacterium]|jgi:hypothetical protein